MEKDNNSEVLQRAIQAIDQMLGQRAEVRVDQDDLGLWLRERCLYHRRVLAPVAVLYRDCAEWRTEHALPPVALEMFTDGLAAAGLELELDFCCCVALQRDLCGLEML